MSDVKNTKVAIDLQCHARYLWNTHF